MAPVLGTSTTAPVAGSAAVAANPYILAGAAILGALAGADKEKADREKNKFIPKVDVNSITESRLRYERLMRGDND